MPYIDILYMHKYSISVCGKKADCSPRIFLSVPHSYDNATAFFICHVVWVTSTKVDQSLHLPIPNCIVPNELFDSSAPCLENACWLSIYLPLANRNAIFPTQEQYCRAGDWSWLQIDKDFCRWGHLTAFPLKTISYVMFVFPGWLFFFFFTRGSVRSSALRSAWQVTLMRR